MSNDDYNYTINSHQKHHILNLTAYKYTIVPYALEVEVQPLVCVFVRTNSTKVIISSKRMAHILSSVEGSVVDLVSIKRALISVSDKTNLIGLVESLIAYNVEIISTGGTANAIRNAGLPVIEISDYTGSPEILDGRVKTLHPKVHGGLLAVRG